MISTSCGEHGPSSTAYKQENANQERDQMNLEYKKFADISLSDPFFDSLKTDYIEFEDWFKRKADNQAYVFTQKMAHWMDFFTSKKKMER